MIEPNAIIEACNRIAPEALTQKIQRYFFMRFYRYMGTLWIAKITGAKNHASAYECADLHLNPGNKMLEDPRPYIREICFSLGVEPE